MDVDISPWEERTVEEKITALISNVPQEVKQYHRWMVWRYGPEPLGGGKRPKYALNTDCAAAVSWQKEENWMSFTQAIALLKTNDSIDGIALVLTQDMNIIAIDVDNAVSGVVTNFRTYRELSPSGNGLRLLGMHDGTLEVQKKFGNVEVFTHKKWVTITGEALRERYFVNCQRETEDLIGRLSLRGDVKILNSRGQVDFHKLAEKYLRGYVRKLYLLQDIPNDGTSLSECDYRVLLYFAQSKFSDEELEQIGRDFRRRAEEAGYGDKQSKADRDDYWTRTIKSVRTEVKQSVRSWSTVTVNEILARPEPDWLVRGLIPEVSVGMLWGDWGAGKTFLTLDLVFKLASHDNWFGLPIKQGASLYVIGEGVQGISDRAQAWFTYFGDDRFWYTPIFREEPVDILNPDHVFSMMNFIRHGMDDCKLVVIDTLSRAMVGKDENAAENMSVMVDNVTRISQEMGVAVLLVHHPTKDQSNPTARGSGSIEAALDYSLRVEQHKAAAKPGTKDEPNFYKGAFILQCIKMRHAPRFDPIYFHLVPKSTSAVVERYSKDDIIHFSAINKLSNEAKSAIERFVGKGYKNAATVERKLQERGIKGTRRDAIQVYMDRLSSIERSKVDKIPRVEK